MSYIPGSTEFGINYDNGNNLNMEILCVEVEGDWGGELQTRRSTYG